jgi:hypothetical protein
MVGWQIADLLTMATSPTNGSRQLVDPTGLSGIGTSPLAEGWNIRVEQILTKVRLLKPEHRRAGLEVSQLEQFVKLAAPPVGSFPQGEEIRAPGEKPTGSRISFSNLPEHSSRAVSLSSGQWELLRNLRARRQPGGAATTRLITPRN